MSRKQNKVQARKLRTREAIEKRRAKKGNLDYMVLSINEDYYSTTNHLSYEDVTDLLDLPTNYRGEI